MVQGLSKEELLREVEQAAQTYASKYHGCSRCVLLSLQEKLKLGDDLTFQASTPLAGGIAMMGGACGALTGGLLALGLVVSSKRLEDEAAFRRSLKTGFELCKRFEKEFGSTLCRDLLKARLGRFFNLADPREAEEAKKAGLYEECPKIVGKAARLAAEFLLEIRGESENSQH